ncbi:uncharacterized protein LOC132988424 [Labrus mixtus]|uniref:uncharacterized protein LOC132988424 n=1 Tax=Labrus mixtus TaxID=508554 RepID=UPI0029C0FC64|nr:uncharacterized protein LOC132988424 [Labrus mixtus]
MDRKTNERNYDYHSVAGCHLKLNDLKEVAQDLDNRYLKKEDIPLYPQPEFHVSHLKHDTNRAGLQGIWEMQGFMNPSSSSLLWWSLAVGPKEVMSAERRLLETTYPDRTERQVQMQQSFLQMFASSPAFLSSSRLGSYRFTFGLEEVLRAYSNQFCGGAEPVMRALRTDLYKQEVMYAVVVHGPAHQQLYDNHPLLTDDPDSVCAYKDGYFVWKSEAMCETHRYQLVCRDDEKQMGAECCSGWPEFYVWDNFAVALHVDDQVLKFDVDRLRESLTFCDRANTVINRLSFFDRIEEAEEFVRVFWSNYPSALKR